LYRFRQSCQIGRCAAVPLHSERRPNRNVGPFGERRSSRIQKTKREEI